VNKKAKFYQIYANLPLPLRSEIVIVINKEPFTWQSAKLEIDNGTDIGKLIIDKLINLNIIPNDE